MYMIIWRFQARGGFEKEFERAYGRDGEWVDFFHSAEGYLGTHLLREVEAKGCYITIDKWTSEAAYEVFRSEQRGQYEAIDRKCEPLTEYETLLGSFISNE